MDEFQRKINYLVKEGLATVRALKWHQHLSKAWDLLQEYNDDGDAIGPLPYTEETLDVYLETQKIRSDDHRVIHHLAICCHARAWDAEIAGDDHALDHWRRAIKYWRMLQGNRFFWESLEQKMRQCDPQVNSQCIAQIRKNLMENLLDIHVGFVRYYCEINQSDRALAHVRLVKGAQIPPGLQRGMVDKIFQAMTGHIEKMISDQQHYSTSLNNVEQFLSLYPDYMPALRLYVELSIVYISRLSYERDWHAIVILTENTFEKTNALAHTANLDRYPLARTACVEYCTEVVRRCYNRANSIPVEELREAVGSIRFDDTLDTYDLVVKWARIGYRHSATGSFLRQVLPWSLRIHACYLAHYADYVQANSDDGSDVLTTIRDMLKQAAENLKEAITFEPDDSELKSSLAAVNERIHDLVMDDIEDSLFRKLTEDEEGNQ